MRGHGLEGRRTDTLHRIEVTTSQVLATYHRVLTDSDTLSGLTYPEAPVEALGISFPTSNGVVKPVATKQRTHHHRSQHSWPESCEHTQNGQLGQATTVSRSCLISSVSTTNFIPPEACDHSLLASPMMCNRSGFASIQRTFRTYEASIAITPRTGNAMQTAFFTPGISLLSKAL